VMLDQPGMQSDLGGIGKGYAADAALQVLEELGIRRALVAASGDLAIGEAPPGKDGWRIGIGDSARVVELRDEAVSTSGASAQFVEIDGQRYSHIVDPVTGIGLRNAGVVTVMARRGIDADSLATAASVMGQVGGAELIARRGARVWWTSEVSR